MLGLANAVLSKLPLNGWKVVVGYLMTMASSLPFPAEVQGVLAAGGALVTAIGVFHRAVKNLVDKAKAKDEVKPAPK